MALDRENTEEWKREVKKEQRKLKTFNQRPKAGYWAFRPGGQRGRPACRVQAVTRDQFMRQTRGSKEMQQSAAQKRDEHENQEAPVPMTTCLCWKQLERAQAKDADLQQTQTRDNKSCAAQWDVQQVYLYIRSLPGGQSVAEEFRSQRINGEALLMLTEDHLLQTMNVKLGLALKLCSHISSLKDMHLNQ